MKRPDDDKSLETLLPVVNGTMPVIFVANRENDIERALNLADEYKIKAIIAGGQEAYKFTERLKKQNVPVLLSMNLPKRTAAASPDADPESMDTLRFRAEAPKTAGKLAAAGIKFAFQNGGATPTEFLAAATKATENGLSKEVAIKAMTLGAADIFGVDDRLGSVEKGKIANLTVVRGELFSPQRVVTHVFVDGKVFEIKAPVPTTSGPGGRGPRGGGAPPVGGQAPGGTTPSIAAVGGNYTISIQIPGQTMNGSLALTQQGSTVTGTMTTDLGTVNIRDGKATANGFSFSASVNYDGQTIDITVIATLTGTQLSGTLDSPMGAIPVTGTKNP
jgi:hypothetical protein